MALSHGEIQQRLTELAQKWSTYEGSEKSEAQSFLTELLACYGTTRDDVGALFEVKVPSGYVDMLWPGVCLVEMKHPDESKKLPSHKSQAFRYWQEAGTDEHPPAQYIVLCAFRRFDVWQPGYPDARASFDLIDLPYRLEALGFLGGLETRFYEDRAELTREAVLRVTEVYRRLEERGEADPETRRDFVLQSVWSMFAEDFGMIPGHRFTAILDELLRSPQRSSVDDLGQLFRYLAEAEPRPPARGMYAEVPWANGGLFADPARVELDREEVELLREATRYDWKLVEPAIFGSLLEGALGPERQWGLGAHYTAEADILKVVEPTVIEPWRERIAACKTLADVEAAQADLAGYVVLDPACGSGNFLYVAYRGLRRIENELRDLERTLRLEAGLGGQSAAEPFPLENMRGIEIEGFGAQLARVTLSMGQKLAVEELGLDEAVLPLPDLSGIWHADALRVEWPRADAIVGNPPYHGSQQIRSELGDEYAEWLKQEFGIGLKDFAVYWFRKAHERLEPGGRAGLVATNSVSQGRARGASLQWIVENGGVITNAISTQDWSGAAAVDVSIVNWIKEPPETPSKIILDGAEVEGISPALRSAGLDVSEASRLAANRGQAFQGPIPADGGGFILSVPEAERLLATSGAEYREVVRPYLTAEDIAETPRQEASRYVIDFGVRRLEEAAQYPTTFVIVRQRVKPFRDKNRDPGFRERWWLFGRPRGEMRVAIAPLDKYIAGVRHGKRVFFCWCDAWTMASDATNTFAFDDDYSMGILSTRIHHEWARAQSSTLEDRFRYTPTSAFETFPWPQPTPEQRQVIAEAARAMIARRQEICLERQIGLTTLYNEVDDGAYQDLRQLHERLDEAVAAAYGWPKSAAHDRTESNRRLLELNRKIAAGEIEYAPFRD
ncbi:MAG: DNA methyltransferase [Gaiellaceae bacterium]